MFRSSPNEPSDEVAPLDPQEVRHAETRIEKAFAGLAMLGLALLCLIVTITVLSRWLWRPLIPDDVLIVRELMVAVILLPLAAVTARGAHISVTVFTEWLKPQTRRWLTRFGHLVGLFLVGALMWAGGRLFLAAWRSGEYYDGDIYIPMYIGYGVFMLALTAFALRLLARILLPEPR